MPVSLALALVCVLASAPGAPSSKDGGPGDSAGTGGGPAPSPAIAALVDSAAAAEVMVLEVEGQLDVERVRRRLGALKTLEGSARPTLRRGPLDDRLLANRILALALLRFAAELDAARMPRAARGAAAAGPWQEQLEATLRRVHWRAAAHLRSCRDLAVGPARADVRRTCGEELVRLSVMLGEAVAAESPRGEEGVRAVRDARLPELQSCFDDWAADRPEAPNPNRLMFTARLGVDAEGRVSSVAISPQDSRHAGLYDCVSDGLWLWAFPGLEEAEIELPLRLGLGASSTSRAQDGAASRAGSGGAGR